VKIALSRGVAARGILRSWPQFDVEELPDCFLAKGFDGDGPFAGELFAHSK
jgi:hypothetical protein